MTATRHPATRLAHAPAYVRVDQATGLADVICGEQADYILAVLHPDEDVRPGRGGVFHVSLGHGVPDLMFLPLARRRVPDAAAYLFSTSPDGRTQQPRGTQTAAEMHHRLARARGQIHLLADGTRISLFRGRRAATWTPVPPEESR